MLAEENRKAAKGENYNPMEYLSSKGFINVQAREALAKLSGVERTGGQLSSLLGVANTPLAAKSGMDEKFEQFKSSDPWAAQEAARNDTRLAEYKAGVGEGGIEIWKKNMYKRTRCPGRQDGVWP